MEISIVMPTYNRAFTISKAIQSIIMQTWQGYELVIIDDGSTDETSKKIQKHLNKNVRYIRTKHKGTPYAWNYGIKESKHDFVFLIGDDVVLHPNCLAALADSVEKVDKRTLGAIAPRLIYTADLINPKENDIEEKYAYLDPYTGDVAGSFNVKAAKTVEVPILHGYSLVQKKMFFGVGGFDERTYKGNYYREETDLWLRLKNRGVKLYYEPKAKVYCQKSLTKGGQWSNVGGRLLAYEYYVIRNHREFLKKFYGKRRFFMLLTFVVRRFYITLLQMQASLQHN